MRAAPLLVAALVALLALAAPASAEPLNYPVPECKAPYGQGIILYVTTVSAATCQEALRLHALTERFVCDVYGC